MDVQFAINSVNGARWRLTNRFLSLITVFLPGNGFPDCFIGRAEIIETAQQRASARRFMSVNILPFTLILGASFPAISVLTHNTCVKALQLY